MVICLFINFAYSGRSSPDLRKWTFRLFLGVPKHWRSTRPNYSLSCSFSLCDLGRLWAKSWKVVLYRSNACILREASLSFRLNFMLVFCQNSSVCFKKWFFVSDLNDWHADFSYLLDLKSALNHISELIIIWNYFGAFNSSVDLPGLVVISINELLIAFWSSGLSEKTFSDSPKSAFWMLLISILNFSFM